MHERVARLVTNIFNVWYAANEHQVKFENLPAPRLIFPGGSDLPMMPDYTLCVRPAGSAQPAPVVRQVSASVITRGQTGTTYLDTQPLPPADKIRMELALQHLNDPAPRRAKSLHKIMDNVPSVLTKAN